MNPVVDPGSTSGADVFAGDGASAESVTVSATEDARLRAGSELEEGGRSGSIDGGRDWSRDGCSGWRAPHQQRWRRRLIRVDGGSVSLISWPRDACHVVRKTRGALRI